ncbi:MAG: hypothetical protein GXO77_13555 [Calditrichaeota bacterium]|nr:hypothetical protein [Calditrichota bacterium]
MIKKFSLQEPSAKQLRSFSAIMFAGFSLFAFLAFQKQNYFLFWILLTLIFIVLLGQFIKPLLIQSYHIWMILGQVLGFFTSRIILTLIFYGIITPIGLILRLTGKKPLDTKFRDGKSSYWKQRKTGQSDLEKLF